MSSVVWAWRDRWKRTQVYHLHPQAAPQQSELHKNVASCCVKVAYWFLFTIYWTAFSSRQLKICWTRWWNVMILTEKGVLGASNSLCLSWFTQLHPKSLRSDISNVKATSVPGLTLPAIPTLKPQSITTVQSPRVQKITGCFEVIV